ncbi:MAG: holo-ACP synthase [Streptococcaceae bacterium]|jgi:holo-[acyl-carrier protein] synthase|nr:holo-ACP synthase [Streptococcaceae bacterium]
MLYGIGVDNVEVARMVKAMQRESFVKRMLTAPEFERFSCLQTEKAKSEFLAGEWAAKEAYSKAYGTGYNGELSPLDMTVASDAKGKPYFAAHPFDGVAQLSMTHDGGIATAIVTLEVRDD